MGRYVRWAKDYTRDKAVAALNLIWNFGKKIVYIVSPALLIPQEPMTVN
jgi:hypothetical protein